MQTLAEVQRSFIQYLQGQSDVLAGAVARQGSVDVDTRLNIYRNAYRLRLREALSTDHDILWTYLGDDLFAQMVEGYIDSHPSSYVSLRHFGDALPEYLLAAEPFRLTPVIHELASFERRLLDVFDAAESERVGLKHLHQIPADHWPGMTLCFHPAVRFFCADWNSVEIWKALKDSQSPPVATVEPVRWLLWRGETLLSEFRPLDTDEYLLLTRALAGCTFAELCESLPEQHDDMDIAAVCLDYLVRWVEGGLVRSITHEKQLV